MAEIAIGIATELVVKAVEILFQKVHSTIKRRIFLVRSLAKNIDFLRGKLPAVKELMLDAHAVISNVNLPSQSSALISEAFVRGLKKFVYNGEDIVDEFNIKVDRGCMGFKEKLAIAGKLKGLYTELEELLQSRQHAQNILQFLKQNLRVHGDAVGRESHPSLLRNPSTNVIQRDDFQTLGRDEEKASLVRDLLGNKSKPSVVLLTGMGGIGKTTLAHTVLKDPQIVSHFAFTKWVTVGDRNLDTKKVLDQLIDGGDAADTLDKAKEKVRAELEGERFLIVLDDVWNAKDLKDRWNELWAPLSFGGEGSRVIVTTREKLVKAKMEAIHVEVKDLTFLSDKECLQIFETFAFPDGSDTSCSSSSQGLEMVSKKRIGKRIVREKVKGVPLAARVIGSSLRGKGVRYWEAAATEIKQRDMNSAILWSYLNLPVHLKQCFAFCSLFPKDTPLDRTYIVRLWMAHGFVDQSDALYGEAMTLVDIGHSYFDHLVDASLIEVDELEDFQMHDLIRDFACNILGEQHPQTLRHLIATQNYSLGAFTLGGPDHLFDSRIGQLATARSLCIHRDYSIHLPEIFLTHLFKKLLHVRYLDISGICFPNLPECVCSMSALQTLILCKKNQNVQTIGFPDTMSKQLLNLHHIEAGHNVSRIGGLGRLTKLHSIGGRFILDEGNWQSIEELRNLKQLRGTLAIEGLRHVQCSELACKEQLLQNHGNLKVLVYDMSGEYETSQVLNYLQPPGNVEDLEIKHYRMDDFPTWLGNAGFNMVSLRLINCSGEKLPPLGRHLKKLYMFGMKELEQIDGELPPSLKLLDIDSCSNLQCLGEKLPSSLQQLGIDSCPNLQALPEKLPSSLKRLNIRNYNNLRALPVELPSELEYLNIHSCPKIQTLPKKLPASLRILDISECNNLIYECKDYPLLYR